MIVNYLKKPEYFFRPAQIFRRLFFSSFKKKVILPWNHVLYINCNENIGASLVKTGFHDLTVAESIVRLLDSTDVAVDAGANIGYFTSLMSVIAKQVYAFEPHPRVLKTLKKNIDKNRIINVKLTEVGLSDKNGKAHLKMPKGFAQNEGTAAISGEVGSDTITIEIVSLDEIFNERIRIGVMKMDVEGHEIHALLGAKNLLSKGMIRDIIFEDHLPQPSEVSKYLLSFGYEVYRLEKGLLKLYLHPYNASLATPNWETPNYIATIEPERLKERFSVWGWRCMGKFFK